jgi:hypothetical protein
MEKDEILIVYDDLRLEPVEYLHPINSKDACKNSLHNIQVTHDGRCHWCNSNKHILEILSNNN